MEKGALRRMPCANGRCTHARFRLAGNYIINRDITRGAGGHYDTVASSGNASAERLARTEGLAAREGIKPVEKDGDEEKRRDKGTGEARISGAD